LREHQVIREDSRKLLVAEDGDPRGTPVFSLHGTPGCRLLYSKHVDDARVRGIRLIGYDRPGYGGSTPQAGRNLASVAGDVAAIADELGIDRFGVWGHSGGGAPALACAALLPRRVVAASCLAGVAPFGADGLDPLKGMGELNVEDFRLMLDDRPRWEAKMEADAAAMASGTLDQLIEMLSSLISPVDREALSPALTAFLFSQVPEAVRFGGAGMRDDSLCDVAPWGFELSSIRVPVQVWHGAHDWFVPFQHGEWLAAHVPGAEAHLDPQEGHLSLYERRLPEVHQWLLSHV
jgi:pimeloyl-ACP methyl ester carboxylesterase